MFALHVVTTLFNSNIRFTMLILAYVMQTGPNQSITATMMLKQIVAVLFMMYVSMFVNVLGGARAMWRVIKTAVQKPMLRDNVVARQAARSSLRWPCL